MTADKKMHSMMVVLIGCLGFFLACTKDRQRMNPYDPSSLETNYYETNFSDGTWSASQLDSSVATPNYYPIFSCANTLYAQDGGATGVTQIACVRASLVGIPKNSTIVNAYLNGYINCGTVTQISFLTQVFGATTTYTIRPSSIFLATIPGYVPEGGGVYGCTNNFSLNVTTLVQGWINGSQTNDGLMVACQTGVFAPSNNESFSCPILSGGTVPNYGLALNISYH